eukprot:4062243-Pyramimonas_sp.AAC.1
MRARPAATKMSSWILARPSAFEDGTSAPGPRGAAAVRSRASGGTALRRGAGAPSARAGESGVAPGSGHGGS